MMDFDGIDHVNKANILIFEIILEKRHAWGGARKLP